MLFIFIDIFLNGARLIFKIFCILLCFLIFILLFYILKKPVINEYKYEIWYKSLFFFVFFFLFFIVFFFIIKINRNTIDLISIYDFINHYKDLFIKTDITEKILYICIFFCFICFWLLIFYKLQKKCKKELITLYLYQFSKNPQQFWNTIDNILDHYMLSGISYKISMVLHNITYKFYIMYPKEYLHKPISKIVGFPYFILPKLHYFILIFCLIYDLYSSYFLFFTTKFLPIFFIYFLWVNLSNFLKQQNPSMNKIIVEQYYNAPNVLYINLSDLEETIIKDYKKTLKYPKELLSTEDYLFLNPLIKVRRFILIKGSSLGENENDIYYNDFLQIAFNSTDLILKNDKFFVEEEKFFTLHLFVDDTNI